MGELSVEQAQAEYATLPALVQPHTLDETTLETCGIALMGATNARPILSAISCSVDYAHILAATHRTVEAKQIVNFAKHRNNQVLEEVKTSYGNHPLVFDRLTQARLNGIYLPYYVTVESLPHDDGVKSQLPSEATKRWEFQRRAYHFVQENVYDPLLNSEPRPDFEARDVSEVNSLANQLLVLQILNRTLRQQPDIDCTPIPANIREKHISGHKKTPPSVEKCATFAVKLVFRDHTMLPISTFGLQRRHDLPERHPAVAEVCWHDADFSARRVQYAGYAMQREVSRQELSPKQRELLDRATGYVLRAVTTVEPLGESVYGPKDPRTLQSRQAYERLQLLADQYTV